METLGAEAEFIKYLVQEEDSFALSCLSRYFGVLNDELSSILDLDFSTATTQKLSALIRSRQLRGLSAHQTACAPLGNLIDVRPEYLGLSISCGRTLFHRIRLSDRDAATFIKNNVDVVDSRNDPSPLGWGIRRTNVIESWALIDAGIAKPEDVLSVKLSTAARVLIYDRYFDADALDVLADAIAHASRIRNEILPCDMMIIYEQSALTKTLVHNKIKRYLDAPAKFIRSSRVGNVPIHDRYMQIDGAYTFIFTAGLGCFYNYDRTSKMNRASTVTLNDLSNVFETCQVRLEDGSGVIIDIAY